MPARFQHKPTNLSLLLLGLALLQPHMSSAQPLNLGDPAPRLVATSDSGAAIDLAALYAAGPVLVYFFPKADTPGCTAQACNLRDNFDDLKAASVTVIGVSTDGVRAQAAFRQKYELPFTLLADADGSVVKAFGVPTAMGFSKRQSFLVVEGKIAWRDLSATPRTQSQDVLAALAALRP